MRKILLIWTALFLSINCFSQSFKEKELDKLNSLGINLKEIDTNDPIAYADLKAILKKDKKRKASKTVGIVLTSLSAVTITHGILVFSQNKNEQEGLGQSIGMMLVAAGGVKIGASIPLFVFSNKRKKERNKLIELYNSKDEL